MNGGLPLIEMNKEQVVKIIKYIDSSQDEETKKDVFSRLGNECFICRHADEYAMSFSNNIQILLDEVNIEKKAPYWEKLEFNEDKTILYLTGKETDLCVCTFGRIKNPPKSLCIYCCKTFQEKLFGAVFNKKVTVEITESGILGGKRCSTAIHIDQTGRNL